MNTGDNTSKGALDSECRSSSQHWKRIYIKCLSNLPKRAFSNFAERYITNIEPIWMADEDLIQEGSLCISVCFILSRLQDEIAAVIQVTPKGKLSLWLLFITHYSILKSIKYFII